MPPLTPAADSAAVQAFREQLREVRGPRYWRALEELSTDPAFDRHLRETLPQWAQAAAMDRRGFLKLLGASLALAGLTACSGPPQEEIVPWLQRPPGMTPGLPQFYATALQCCGDAEGVLVETHMGRPSKIEGNPAHPASLGATDALMQAAVLQLWDPDRSQAPVHHGTVASWDDFLADAAQLATRFTGDGQGLHVLSAPVVSPTLAAQREALLKKFPGARWHAYDAVRTGQAQAGAMLAFGRPLRPRYHFDKARVIVSLEADFLAGMPGRLRYARDFAALRKPVDGAMNRLYVIEATPSLTGAMADHRWPLGSARIAAFAWELARQLDVGGAPGDVRSGIAPQRMQALADDLRAHRGQSLVLAGESQPPAVHALAHALNQALGNVGRTVDYLEAPADAAATNASGTLPELVVAMREGSVDTLLILDGNPAYTAPADLDFAGQLRKVPHAIHAGLYADETAQLCEWHLPLAHTLESWSDARAWDGTASIVQPLIAPLYGGRGVHEILAALLGQPPGSARDRVRATWRDHAGGADFDAFWNRSLRDGVIAGTAASPAAASVAARMPPQSLPPSSDTDDTLELVFRPDPTVWDGRYANNGWLQELPKPLTQLTWSNAALVSPQLAAERNLANGDVVELRVDGRHVRAPVWIMPGQAARSVTVHLGYGRRQAGHVGDGLGFDAYVLRDNDTPWAVDGLQMQTTGEHVELACTQHHQAMEGRAPVRNGTLQQFLAEPGFVHADEPPAPRSLYPPRRPGEYAWGMAIDLNACIGCKACTIACQAENNIPVVGADQVRRGREMHWIRVDRYYEGPPQAPLTHHQPVPCMMCEHAPCELVCPVGATLHDSEGLNLQVYNRCVGTRFCSNNCPYKVRRFNFLQYTDLDAENLKAQRNPDVSVRNRGVMEKCTYCIQRIETAHIAADAGGRRIADGEILTACQAVCPTQAIHFGDIADPSSDVSRAKASPLDYTVLQELNTRPRTTYLAQLRNPNPALGDDA